MVLAVGDGELEITVLAEISLQPLRLCPDLFKDSKQQLLGCNRSVEDTDALTIGAAGVSPCLD